MPEEQNQTNPDNAQEAADAYKAKKEQKESPLPKVDLSTFVLSLSSSVMVHLGEVPEPETGQITQNLDMARHTIDILAMLENKTQGNLTQDEERLFRDILFELRMKYVQKA
jgi:hypothetical protein